MKIQIFVTLEVDGVHNWPDAKKHFPEVSFLSDLHRHLFKMKLKKTVHHDNRDVEFIMLKRNVLAYLKSTYYDSLLRTHYFGSKSCEQIAIDLIREFDCDQVEVSEDGENGAIITL